MEDKNFIMEFIETYRSLPALWNIKSKDYSDKYIKHSQYELLLEKYKEKCPEATKKDVTQKINSLRTAYRRELKRISNLERSGAGLTDENDANLYYYDAMSFLRDNELPCPSRSTICNENHTEDEETPTKRKKPDPGEEFLTLATQRLMKPRDEFRKIVEPWAHKLKQMDATQAILAEKFINEILFEGLMGTLQRNSMQLNLTTTGSTSQLLNQSNIAHFGKQFPKNPSLVQTPSLPPQSTDSNCSYVYETDFVRRPSSLSPQSTVSNGSYAYETDFVRRPPTVPTPTISPQSTASNCSYLEKSNFVRNSPAVQIRRIPRNIKIVYADQLSSTQRPSNNRGIFNSEIHSDGGVPDTAQYFSTFK